MAFPTAIHEQIALIIFIVVIACLITIIPIIPDLLDIFWESFRDEENDELRRINHKILYIIMFGLGSIITLLLVSVFI